MALAALLAALAKSLRGPSDSHQPGKAERLRSAAARVTNVDRRVLGAGALFGSARFTREVAKKGSRPQHPTTAVSGNMLAAIIYET